MNNHLKIFYFHIPKTAGTSINHYFSNLFENNVTHVETKNINVNDYNYVSGHVSFSRMSDLLDTQWAKIITFREPYSYVVSHLCWVRKLADEGEEKRFFQHPKTFQQIALKMKSFDFSHPIQITEFIIWLDSIKFSYFHNTQTLYLDFQKDTNNAIKSLNEFEFIGVMEETDMLLNNINYEYSFNKIKPETPRKNVNSNKYGFDLNNIKTRQALLPLLDKDIIIYKEAKKLFDLQNLLYKNKPDYNIIGFVDTITEKKITGWARSKNSLQKVVLELIVNNQVIEKTTANLFRLGLKRNKIHPTGCCSFCFDLDNAIDLTSDISIRVSNTNITLKNST